ncbi:MAG: BspA family leucine-rich repeat surface protein [Streptococcaceae bacterium]|jgi:LPXTG-motif cell wall-anchored protein|nr:BspA family leucine-rich repeat surface protein [Streptococcaceae bacterium]
MNLAKKLFYLTILVISIFTLGSAKAHASYDTSGVWTEADGTSLDPGVNWKFDAASGTLTFSGGNTLPKTGRGYENERPWFMTDATDEGEAIRKIVFEQPIRLSTSPAHLFYRLENLESIDGLEKLDASQAVDMRMMFQECKKLENIDGVAGWDVSNVTDLSFIFSQCENLKSLAALKDWNVSNATGMGGLFSGTDIKNTQGLENWNTGNAINMGYLFSGCKNLENLDGLLNWDVRKNTSLILSFYECFSLENLDGLRNWKADNLVDMGDAFASCEGLKNADAVKNWHVNKLISAGAWFASCTKMKSVDLSTWNTRNISLDQIFYIFSNCPQLESITLGKDSVMSSHTKLAAIDTKSGIYTGEWIGLNTGKVYSSSDDFMTNYDGSQPDTYVWRKAPTYTVNYRFISSLTEKTLPDEITKLLPSAAAGNLTQAMIDSPVLSVTKVTTADGTWTFKGWDKAQVKIENTDEVVTGIWEFTANPVPDKPKPEDPDQPKPEDPNNSNPTNPKPGNNSPSPIKQPPTPNQPAPAASTNDCPKINTILPKTGDRSDILLAIFGLLIIGSVINFFIFCKQNLESQE